MGRLLGSQLTEVGVCQLGAGDSSVLSAPCLQGLIALLCIPHCPSSFQDVRNLHIFQIHKHLFVLICFYLSIYITEASWSDSDVCMVGE